MIDIKRLKEILDSPSDVIHITPDDLRELVNLADPTIDTCDLGHRFAKLPDHPTREGLPCCPHCMKEGLLGARAEVVMLRESLDDTMGKLVDAAKKLDRGKIYDLEQGLNALAAHVERITEAIHALIAESVGVVGLHMNGDVAEWEELLPGGRFEDWLMALEESPPTSLARLKAQWQAEALEQVLSITGKYFHSVAIRIEVEEMLTELRRQAEGKS